MPLWILSFFVSVFAFKASAKEMVFGFIKGNPPPLAFISKNDSLQKGIIKDIGDAIAKKMNVTPRFRLMSRKRAEDDLTSAKVHYVCTYNPRWFSDKNKVNWSPVLYEKVDAFVTYGKKTKGIKGFADLKGMRIGTIRGYYYHPEVMKGFKQKTSQRVDVTKLEQSLAMLSKGRSDTVLDSKTLIQFNIKNMKKDVAQNYNIQEFSPGKTDIHCAMSKKSPFSQDKFNEAVTSLVNEGKIQASIKSYVE